MNLQLKNPFLKSITRFCFGFICREREQPQGNRVNPLVLHESYANQNRVHKSGFASLTRSLSGVTLLHMVSDLACQTHPGRAENTGSPLTPQETDITQQPGGGGHENTFFSWEFVLAKPGASSCVPAGQVSPDKEHLHLPCTLCQELPTTVAPSFQERQAWTLLLFKECWELIIETLFSIYKFAGNCWFQNCTRLSKVTWSFQLSSVGQAYLPWAQVLLSSLAAWWRWQWRDLFDTTLWLLCNGNGTNG